MQHLWKVPTSSQWHHVALSGCRLSLEGQYIIYMCIYTARCRVNRLCALYVVCWVIKMWKAEWPKITVKVTGAGGRRGAVTFSIRRVQACDWLKTIFSSLSLPPASCLPPSHQTLDGTQGPDHRRSMAPRGYRVCVCLCVHGVCVSPSLEGRDPGYVVEVCSGQGPDRTWPSGGSSASPIGQVAINQHPLSRLQPTTSNTWED